MRTNSADGIVDRVDRMDSVEGGQRGLARGCKRDCVNGYRGRRIETDGNR